MIKIEMLQDYSRDAEGRMFDFRKKEDVNNFIRTILSKDSWGYHLTEACGMGIEDSDLCSAADLMIGSEGEEVLEAGGELIWELKVSFSPDELYMFAPGVQLSMIAKTIGARFFLDGFRNVYAIFLRTDGFDIIFIISKISCLFKRFELPDEDELFSVIDSTMRIITGDKD